MNKQIFILAMTALGFVACSSDETITSQATSEANEISFRPLTNGVTRANGPITGAFPNTAGESFNVCAEFFDASVGNEGETRKYFQADFTKLYNASNFTSENNYYWPAFDTGDKLTFTAIYGGTQSTEVPGRVASYTVYPQVSNQMDLMVARKEYTASGGSTPVVLNFRHALSQVIVHVRNQNPNLIIEITDFRVGNVYSTGTFDYNQSAYGEDPVPETTTHDGGKVAPECWSSIGSAGNYDQTLASTITFTGTTYASEQTVATLGSPLLLIPQSLSASTGYSTPNSQMPTITGSTAPTLTGNYLALKMTIKNNDANGTVISSARWCCWPVDVTWNPGYKYTFLIDAGNGGYQPVDIDNDATSLDKVLGDVIVFSASCTVDSWSDGNEATITNPQ